MSRRSVARTTTSWAKLVTRSMRAITRATKVKPATARAKPVKVKPAKARPSRAKVSPKKPVLPADQGDWLPGFSMGSAGARRYWLYRPPGIQKGERLPLLVMLHGCNQDAADFAASTRMNTLARRERFLVLYPEQSRLDNAQRCWNWYDTRGGGAQREAARIMTAIDQVQLRQPADGTRIALLGLSAGASMAALLATSDPDRFQALVMHSGVPPGVANSTATALAAMRGQRLPQPRQPGLAAEHRPPLMVFQGESDHVVSHRNGQALVQLWADSLGAGSGVQRQVQRGQRYPMTVTDFKQRGRTLVSLVSVARLGHAWSGGAASQPYSDPRGPDATRMAWTFISRQFRLGARVGTATPRARSAARSTT